LVDAALAGRTGVPAVHRTVRPHQARDHDMPGVEIAEHRHLDRHRDGGTGCARVSSPTRAGRSTCGGPPRPSATRP